MYFQISNTIVVQIKGVWSKVLDETVLGQNMRLKKGVSSLKNTEVTAISFDEFHSCVACISKLITSIHFLRKEKNFEVLSISFSLPFFFFFTSYIIFLLTRWIRSRKISFSKWYNKL